MPEPRFDEFPEWNFIAQLFAGTPPVKVLRWLLQISGVSNSVFLPSGLLDWVQQEDPVGSPPDSPTAGRVRSFIANRLLQIEDEDGNRRTHGELIASTIGGILEPVPPGPAGSILISDVSEPTCIGWAQVLSISDLPGQFQFGSLLDYGALSSVIPAEIQYDRVYLTKSTAISTMRCFLGAGGSPLRNVRMGIYSQADPADISGIPVTREEQAASTVTTGFTNDYMDIALTSPFVVPATGFYWLAFITDTGPPLTFATTPGTFPQDFLPVWRETSAGTTLPATAGVLTNPASGVVFVAAKE